jgi:hypothetical protein
MIHRAAAAIVALALAPALAHADADEATGAPATQAPVPPAPPAPQNESWSNVSHINGQLVPVGQRTDYLYSFRKTNISANPIGMMFGYYGASVSFALSQNVAIRLDGNAWSLDHGERTGYELGVTAPIYFRRTYSGPYFEPGLIVHGDSDHYDYAYDCATCSTSNANHWVGPQMLFGWQWMFDSGLNVSAAFGAARNTSDSSSDEPVPVGYFRIGYAL